MANVLLIEDEPTYQKIVAAILSQQQLRIASTLGAARALMSNLTFDLILLDMSLPDGSGLEFFSEIQERVLATSTPVIFLTGNTDVEGKVVGFALGADDYITKPIEPIEFRARVESKLKKRGATRVPQNDPNHFRCFGLCFDLAAKSVAFEKDGSSRALSLTYYDFKLLLFLAKNSSRTVSWSQLSADVWGTGQNLSEAQVADQVHRLQKQLKGTDLVIASGPGGFQVAPQSGVNAA